MRGQLVGGLYSATLPVGTRCMRLFSCCYRGMLFPCSPITHKRCGGAAPLEGGTHGLPSWRCSHRLWSAVGPTAFGRGGRPRRLSAVAFRGWFFRPQVGVGSAMSVASVQSPPAARRRMRGLRVPPSSRGAQRGQLVGGLYSATLPAGNRCMRLFSCCYRGMLFPCSPITHKRCGGAAPLEGGTHGLLSASVQSLPAATLPFCRGSGIERPRRRAFL